MSEEAKFGEADPEVVDQRGLGVQPDRTAREVATSAPKVEWVIETEAQRLRREAEGQ